MQPGHLLVVDAEVLAALSTQQLRDAIAATDPHGVVATEPASRVRLRSMLPDLDRPVLAPGGGSTADPEVHRLRDCQVVVASSDPELRQVAGLFAAGNVDSATETYVVTDRLSLAVRPTELRTLREGLDGYRRAIATGERDGNHSLDEAVTHLSTGLPAGYYGDWDGLLVRGLAPGDLDDAAVGGTRTGAEPAVAAVRLGLGGRVASEQYRAGALGLRAVAGVGESRAAMLREHGVADRGALADADVARLADADGLDRDTAARLVERARAFEDGRVRRESDTQLPSAAPVFVDVETDGLSASTAWLIGALDRHDGRYRSFLADDPDRPGDAITAFADWLATLDPARPIVAYNGASFDFEVIAEQIAAHCTEHVETWERARTFDPYAWAVGEGNAVLPGRTNRLEDVAGAIGFDRDAVIRGALDDPDEVPPLSGAEVARIYRRWRADPSPANEPDWALLEAYCEADVRAVAAVYDAIAAADRTEGHLGRDRATESTQGTLGEF